MSATRLELTLFWMVMLGAFLSIIFYNITLVASSKNHKRIKKIVSVFVALTFANIFRMCTQECYNFDNATVEFVDTIAYKGEEVLINGKKKDISCIYSNQDMPRDILVNCNKLKNSFIPGIFNRSEKTDILIVNKDTIKNIRNDISCVKDDVGFFEATKFGLEYLDDMYYEVKKDGNNRLINDEFKDSHSNLNEQSEQLKRLVELEKANEETNKKLEELKNEIKNIENKSEEKHNSIALTVLLVISIIWFIGLITYIIIVKVNAGIKRDLINTSSDAKIREGVMLDK